METVTIVASRGFSMADMEMLLGSVIVIGSATWMMLQRFRHLRGRQQQPNA